MLDGLIGRTVFAVSITQDKEGICFHTDGGDRWYRTERDCCNSVWLNHVQGVRSLWGEEVLGIDEYGWVDTTPTPDLDEYEECLSVSIRTRKGTCDLEFRNNHNGYYGGSVVAGAPDSSWTSWPSKRLQDDF